MKKTAKYLLLLLMCFNMIAGCGNKSETTRIVELTTNDKVNPLGIDKNPYFSWQMTSVEDGKSQSAYRILVSETEKELKKGEYVWDSGKVDSEISVAIPYEGSDLEAEQEYVWQVIAWDEDGKKLQSEHATFEMGKMNSAWEESKWITAPVEEECFVNAQDEVAEIKFDFKMEQTEAGFIWGANEAGYGKHYRWGFSTNTGIVEMRISYQDGEKILSSYAVEINQTTEEFLTGEHNICIRIQDNVADTYVDGVLVSEKVPVENCSMGSIGFFAARDEKKAWCDNIVIKNQNGDILCQEDFEKEENIFKPYYIKVENGWGRVDAGFIVTAGTEVAAPMFRKSFETMEGKEISSARVYASALGIYDVYVNGVDVNSDYAAPGQSVYSKEVYYRTYDVTEQIKEGENAVGIMLGHGRYDRAWGSWGDTLALYAQVVIRYTDGTKQMIGSDDSWLVYTDGPIRNDDVFCGEYYDANYEVSGWSEADGMDLSEEEEAKGDTTADSLHNWKKAVVYEVPQEMNLQAALDQGVTCVDILTPISVSEPVEGTYVYDFGKNFHGACELQLTGKAGDVVTMRYGEYLNTEPLARRDDEVGTIWTRNLYAADDTDYYVFKEDGTVTYSPLFSYRGFQYLQVTGVEEALPLEKVRGLVLATDNERTGYFECSDEKLNRLYNIIYDSQLANYVDIPTDCPQRDERLGWTGDAQVFTYTGALNANTANFMYKYTDALRLSQQENGAYPEIAPFVNTVGSSNGWCDAGVIIVWEMYQQYGNRQVILDNLSAMCKYVDYLVSTSNQYIRYEKGYNDHNAISYPEDACCNTAQCTYVAGLLAKMCEVVGEQELYEKYNGVYESYLNAWRTNFLNEDGSIGQWLQSEYTMALAFGLYPEYLEAAGAEKLKVSVEASDYQMMTGFVTTPHILSMLCKYGYVEEAYKMIQKEGYPSFHYMLEQGASALTERWNTLSVNTDGNVEIIGSLNHVAFGAVGQWFYTDVLGIKRDESAPAYKHFFLEPQVGGGLTYARGSYDSVYGKIESSWEITEDGIKFHFVIPANTSATVTLPGDEYQEMELEAGIYDFTI